MNAISAEIYGFLVSQSIHLAVLFLLIWGLAALFHKQSAHLRYLLWAVILIKCLVPPVLTIPLAVLPEKGTPVSPQDTTTSQILVTSVEQGETEPAALEKQETALLPIPVAAEGSVAQMSEPDSIQASLTPDRSGWQPLRVQQWGVLVWVAGLGVLLLGTLIRAICFARKLKHSRLPLDPRLRHQIDSLAGTFRPGLNIKAYQLEGTGQPFVWGLVRGTIYLPANFARTGTDDTRLSVLLHELAHVVRLDPLINLIQILVQGIYWFHPMVWLANKQIRAEREKCCDEIAIARQKTSPKAYGSAIVDTLVHEYESRMAIPSLAVAGPVKNIEDRIKTIMKPGKQFYSRPTFKAWMIVFVLATTLTPLAVAFMPRIVDSEQASGKDGVGKSEYRTELPNGLTVELVGLCGYPSEGKLWWRPDGTPLAMAIKTQAKSTYTSDDPGYEFAFRQTGNGSFKIDSIKGSKLKSSLEVLSPEGLIAYRAHISSQYRKSEITLAVPTGAWNTVHASTSLNASTSATVRGKTLILGAMISAGEDCIVSCTDELGYQDATRIIVKDSAGREHLGVVLTDTGINGLRQRTIRYEKLALADVSEVRFQVCSYAYRTLKNISLWPNAKSDSDVETSVPSKEPENVSVTHSEDPGKTLHSLFMASGMLCQSIQEALEADDFETALALCQQVETHVDQGLNIADQVEEGAIFKALATQFKLWHDVIKTQDKDRALKLGEMLNEMGSNIAPQVEEMAIKHDSVVTQNPEFLSKEDLQQIEELIQAYSRVPFTMDVKTAERLFEFKDEQEKQLFITMVVEAGAEFESSSRADNKIYIMGIRPAGNNRIDVSALTPFQERYMLRTVPCVRKDQGWKIGIDVQEMINQAQQARELGPEESVRRGLQAQLQMWENAQGQTLVTLYEEAKTQARLRVQAMQFAREKGLPMMQMNFTEEKYQQELEQISAKSPENYRREMIAKYRRQLGPAEHYGKLEFRMLYDAAALWELPGDIREAREQRLRDQLKENGPSDASAQGPAHVWLPLRQPGPNLMDAIIETYQGQDYVLVSNEPNEIMTADGSWGILAVYSQKDYMDRLAIGLELDQPGGEKLRQISSLNVKRAMAIILDGQVLSAPTIMAAVGPHVLITGQFTEQEIRDMVVSLQKGMRVKSTDTPSQAFWRYWSTKLRPWF